MPAEASKDCWTDKLLPLCERAARFVVAKYESNATITPERLWNDYLLERFPTTPHTHFESEERANARLEDIGKLVEWSETIRTPAGEVPAPPTLLEQVNRFGVSELLPKQVFMTVAESTLRPASGTRILIHTPLTVARQYASAICGETYQPETTPLQVPVKRTVAERSYSRAPAPPTILSGGGWTGPEQKANPEVPTNFPPDYPPSLRVRTGLVLADTMREVQDRWTLEQLCKRIVSNLTELLCQAVREGTLMDHAAEDRLKELLHYVTVANCKYDNDRFRAETATINSDEWHALLRQLAGCKQEHGQAVPDAQKTASRAPVSVEGFQAKGRPQKRSKEFERLAAELWLEGRRSTETLRVSSEVLTHTATRLDEAGYTPPADFLEYRVAAQIRSYNSAHSNSKDGCIRTWSALVALNDKDHIRGMRRLLSRCGRKYRP